MLTSWLQLWLSILQSTTHYQSRRAFRQPPAQRRLITFTGSYRPQEYLSVVAVRPIHFVDLFQPWGSAFVSEDRQATAGVLLMQKAWPVNDFLILQRGVGECLWILTVEARKLEHGRPLIPNQGRKENQHKSYIQVPTFWSRLYCHGLVWFSSCLESSQKSVPEQNGLQLRDAQEMLEKILEVKPVAHNSGLLLVNNWLL